MKALVLEEKLKLSLRDIDLPKEVRDNDVKIKMHTVGICGSDIHYYTHGKIGPFVVKSPMVLGHEGAGTVIATGKKVKHLQKGDRVCVEPGVPDVHSREYKLGIYNLDPGLTFWATPPNHGCLTYEVVFPSNFVFKLPDNVSYAEGAMVEPLAVGLQATEKAKIIPGEIGLVMGCGPIGIITALSALAGGCSKVLIADIISEKLKICSHYNGLIPINLSQENILKRVMEETDGWGADIIFEASGAVKAFENIFPCARPQTRIVLVGNPQDKVPLDIATLLTKELVYYTVFRYAHQFDRALRLLSNKKINVLPLITDTIDFKNSIQAFERAAEGQPNDVKLQIKIQA